MRLSIAQADKCVRTEMHIIYTSLVRTTVFSSRKCVYVKVCIMYSQMHEKSLVYINYLNIHSSIQLYAHHLYSFPFHVSYRLVYTYYMY